MPKISAAANPELARAMLEDMERTISEPEKGPPDREPASDLIYELCGGYFLPNGDWVKEFEVRELTGVDEEYLARMKDSARFVIGLLQRGLVRVGQVPVSDDLLDGLLGGDWETVLLGIRIATFGPTTRYRTECRSCREPYEATIDLTRNVEMREVAREDLSFYVQGRHGTSYRVTHAYGSAQRKILEHLDSPAADMNTALLAECVQEVGGKPLIGIEGARNLPMADRRRLLDEIDKRRAGPDLKGVRTKCPACDYEQPASLNVVGLFQD